MYPYSKILAPALNADLSPAQGAPGEGDSEVPACKEHNTVLLEICFTVAFTHI